MAYTFFDTKIGSGTTRKLKANVIEVLVQKLHKPVIKKLKQRKVYGKFKDNIWEADLAVSK